MIWDLNPGRGKRFFSFTNCPDWLWGPPILLFSGYWGSFLRVKGSGRDVDRPLSSNAKVKNEQSYITVYHVCVCVVDRDSFTLQSVAPT